MASVYDLQSKRNEALTRYYRRKYLRQGGVPTEETQAVAPSLANEQKNKGGLLGGIGYVGENIGLGLVRGVEGLSDFIVGGVADLFGNDEFADEILKNDWIDYNHANEWYNPSGVMQTVGDISQGVGAMLPSIATAAAITYFSGGTAAPLAAKIVGGTMLGTQAAGQATSQATKESGTASGKEWLYGIGSGISEAAIEGLSGGLGGYAAGTLLGKQVAKSTAGKLAVSAIGEGLEEVAGDFVDVGLRRATGVEKDAKLPTAKELGRTFVVGAGVGGVLGGAGRGVNAIQAGGVNNLNASENAQELSQRLTENNIRQAEGKNARYTPNDMQATARKLSANLQKMDADKRKAYMDSNPFMKAYFAEDGKLLNDASVSSTTAGNGSLSTYSASLKGREDSFAYAPAQSSSQVSKDAMNTVSLLTKGKAEVVLTDHNFGDVVTADGKKSKINGEYKNGIIYLSANATAADAVSLVAKHEMAHTLEGTKEYNALGDYIREYIKKHPELAKRYNFWDYAMAYANTQQGDYTAETKAYEAQTEIYADFIANEILNSQESVNRLANRDANIVKKFLSWVRTAIKNLGAGKEARAEYKELRRMEKMLAKALDSARGGVTLEEFDKAVRKRKGEAVAEAKGKPAEARASLTVKADKALQDQKNRTTPSARFSLEFSKEIATNQTKTNKEMGFVVDETVLKKGIESTARMVDMLSQHKDILPEDKIGKVLKSNSSYDKSVENTTICVRTLSYNEFIDMVQEKVGRPLTQAESFLASQKLYEIAVEPQCLYCYVSLDRKAYNEFLLRYIKERDDVIEAYKNSNKTKATIEKLYETYRNGRKSTEPLRKRFDMFIEMARKGINPLTASDISTKAKQSEIAARNDYTSVQWKDMAAYAQSASWAKKQVEYAAYYNDILKLSKQAVNNLNKHYGLRFYSFSDYTAAFIVENMQQVTDAAIRGLKGLGYTKDTDFAKIFAPTGMNINISMYAHKNAKTGEWEIDPRQSADLQEAIDLRNKYPNVGIVVTASTDEGVLWALQQEWSDIVIPFHIVRTGADVAEFYKWQNYTNESGDTIADENLWNAYVNGRKKVSKNIYPAEHQNNKDAYFKLIKERGLKPRFERFADNPNYMKLVNETRRSAKDTPAMQPIFDVEAAEKSFNKFVGKGGYFKGWYKQGVNVDAEAKAVAEDVKAGKKANEVSYGRQDINPEDLMKKRKTVRTHKGESRYHIKVFNNDTQTIESNIVKVAKMQSVADLAGDEFLVGQKGLYDAVADYYATFNNNVYNEELGDVELKRRGVKDSVAHGLGKEKTAAFKAVPDIIKNGKVVDYQVKWKGRDYDTAVVAAPITIAGEEYYAVVVVRRTSSNQRFYLHEIGIKNRQAVQTEASADNSAKELGGLPINRIIEKLQNVNTFNKKVEKISTSRKSITVTPQATKINTINTPKQKLTNDEKIQAVKDQVGEKWLDLQIQTTNIHAGIEHEAKVLGGNLESEVHRARASSASAINALTNEQRDYSGKNRVGDSLADIFEPVFKEGEEYTQDFYNYLYHYHNIDRMGLEEKAQAEIDALLKADAKLKEIVERKNIGAQSRERLIKKTDNGKRYLELLEVKNKPVMRNELGDIVTATESKAEVKAIEKAHPEFKAIAEKVWMYSRNLVQYRLDAGLITQELADLLLKKYPHYVPTYREKDVIGTAGVSRLTKGVRVKQTIKKAKGSDADLADISMSLTKQTLDIYRAAAINDVAVKLHDLAMGGKSDNVVLMEEKTEAVNEDTEYNEKLPDQEVAFYKDGKRYVMAVSKPINEGFKAFTSDDNYGGIEKLFEKANQAFKAGVTSLNPLFLIRNFARDMQEAYFYTKYGAIEFSKAIPRAIKIMAKKGDLWQRYLAAGGLQSGIVSRETGVYDSRSKTRKKLAKPLDAMEKANQFIEQIPRFAEFILAIEHGKSDAQALLESADVTTNFSRGGKLAKKLNRTVMPFLNPSIQGFSKLWRTAVGRKSIRQWTQLIVKSLVVGLAVGFFNDLINGDDEDYKNLNVRDKENYYIFPIGDGKFIKIPKGRVVAALGTITSRFKSAAEGDENWNEGWLQSVGDMVTPVGQMTRFIWSPFTDARTNTTWYGGEIEGKGLQNLAVKDRYDEGTSSIAIWMGKTFNISPKKVHYVIDQYLGVIGDIILPLTTEKAERGMISSAFTIDGVTSNRISTDFYDMKDEMMYAKNSGDMYADMVYSYLNKVSSEVSDMYQQKRDIQSNSKLSNKEKLEQTKVIQALINTTMQSAMISAEQFEQILIDMGYTDSIQAILKSKAYNNMDEEMQTKVAKKFKDYSYAMAMSTLTGEKTDAKYYLYNSIGAEDISIYLTEISCITADKDKKGNVTTTRKEKVHKYIEHLKLSKEQKYILMYLAGYTPTEEGKKYVEKYLSKNSFTAKELEKLWE